MNSRQKAILENAKKGKKVDEKSKEEIVITPKLTEKQRRFAELIAHGVDKMSAYRACYNVGEATKEKSVDSLARRLLNNVEVLKEIDRIKEVLDITQSIDYIPDEKRLALLTGESDIEEIEKGEWNQNIAFEKLNGLLKNCEESLILLKERPTLFAKVEQCMNDIRRSLDEGDADNKELFDKMDAIHTLVYKLGAFDAKEYNSTINTANNIMKMLNDITGITKNAKQIENEAFERRLLTLISNMDSARQSKKADYVPLKKQMEEFAFDE